MEVCNKVGGIHTVVSTKAPLMQESYGDRFVLVGPDLYKGESGNREFIENSDLFKDWKALFEVDGIRDYPINCVNGK